MPNVDKFSGYANANVDKLSLDSQLQMIKLTLT